MKKVRIITKAIFFTALFSATLIFSAITYIKFNVSQEFKIKKGADLNIEALLPVTATYNGAELSQGLVKSSIGEEYTVNLKLFGIFPISQANVTVVDELYVNVLGLPFGMRIYTNGVFVSECTEVQTENGIKTPAKDAGLKAGDYILSINGQEVATNEDISRIVEASKGEKMSFKVMRGETKIYLNVKAQKSSENDQYKIGIWVKDSTAGIGMLTFYSPANNTLCGLGHGICDDTTGELLHLKNGEIVEAEIISVEKGEIGAAGQLKGKFGYKTFGKISNNCDKGVYSKTTLGDMGNFVEVALKQDIKNGQAKILCTVEGSTPKYYDCTIEVRSSAYHSATQNLLVTVTDKALLEKTGGIVQGLSGSPILQNGKLIGAVTHVLIDDPTKGYGIFAENMLETAQDVGNDLHVVPQKQQSKEAS